MCYACDPGHPEGPVFRVRLEPEVAASLDPRLRWQRWANGFLAAVAWLPEAFLILAAIRREWDCLAWALLAMLPGNVLARNSRGMELRRRWAFVRFREQARKGDLGPPPPHGGERGYLSDQGLHQGKMVSHQPFAVEFWRWDHFAAYGLDELDTETLRLRLFPGDGWRARTDLLARFHLAGLAWGAVAGGITAFVGYQHFGRRADVLAAMMTSIPYAFGLLVLLILWLWPASQPEGAPAGEPSCPPAPRVALLNAAAAPLEKVTAFLDAHLPRHVPSEIVVEEARGSPEENGRV
jgi:hypothetical protein